jgi:phosphoesterase RecJ-like protein
MAQYFAFLLDDKVVFMESAISALLQCINENKKSIILTTHKNPDGDGLGCMFAMGEMLERRKHEVHYVLGAPVKEHYAGVFPLGKMTYNKPDIPADSLLLSFDCSSPDIISLPEGMNLKEYDCINIDHHVSNLYAARINVVASELASCCELVFDILCRMNEHITPDMATALYAGLLFDTGRFAYSARPECFQVAASLLKCGARHWDVFNALYRHDTLNHFKTNAKLINSLQHYKNLPLIYLHITEDFVKQVDVEESEDLVNYISNIKDLEILAVFRFIDENTTKISLRSRGRYSVSDLALSLGGGGHAKAAGAVVNMPITEASEKVLGLLEQIICA